MSEVSGHSFLKSVDNFSFRTKSSKSIQVNIAGKVYSVRAYTKEDLSKTGFSLQVKKTEELIEVEGLVLEGRNIASLNKKDIRRIIPKEQSDNEVKISNIASKFLLLVKHGRDERVYNCALDVLHHALGSCTLSPSRGLDFHVSRGQVLGKGGYNQVSVVGSRCFEKEEELIDSLKEVFQLLKKSPNNSFAKELFLDQYNELTHSKVTIEELDEILMQSSPKLFEGPFFEDRGGYESYVKDLKVMEYVLDSLDVVDKTCLAYREPLDQSDAMRNATGERDVLLHLNSGFASIKDAEESGIPPPPILVTHKGQIGQLMKRYDGDLTKLLENKSENQLVLKQRISTVLKGVEYTFNCGIPFMDIKPQNILGNRVLSGESPITVLTDLGNETIEDLYKSDGVPAAETKFYMNKDICQKLQRIAQNGEFNNVKENFTATLNGYVAYKTAVFILEILCKKHELEEPDFTFSLDEDVQVNKELLHQSVVRLEGKGVLTKDETSALRKALFFFPTEKDPPPTTFLVSDYKGSTISELKTAFSCRAIA